MAINFEWMKRALLKLTVAPTFFSDENENENPTTENVVKRDYSENRNLYRDDEQVSLCVERYEERLVQFCNHRIEE